MAAGSKHLIFGTLMVGTKKSLGQHWLKNREILDEIAFLAKNGSANKSSEKICLEIGPGLGTLTSSLLKQFEKVIAIEFDERLASNLPKSFPGKNLEVINADILQFDFTTIKEPYIVAGNIPYYITSPIIEKLLTLSNPPARIVLLIQKEVAERILDKKETGLSLFVKNYADVASGPIVKREEFTPPPKVDSQIIIMTPRAPRVEQAVFGLIRVGFVSPRKKLIHNLSAVSQGRDLKQIFTELGIDVNARPGDISLELWQKLSQKLSNS